MTEADVEVFEPRAPRSDSAARTCHSNQSLADIQRAITRIAPTFSPRAWGRGESCIRPLGNESCIRPLGSESCIRPGDGPGDHEDRPYVLPTRVGMVCRGESCIRPLGSESCIRRGDGPPPAFLPCGPATAGSPCCWSAEKSRARFLAPLRCARNDSLADECIDVTLSISGIGRGSNCD